MVKNKDTFFLSNEQMLLAFTLTLKKIIRLIWSTKTFQPDLVSNLFYNSWSLGDVRKLETKENKRLIELALGLPEVFKWPKISREIRLCLRPISFRWRYIPINAVSLSISLFFSLPVVRHQATNCFDSPQRCDLQRIAERSKNAVIIMCSWCTPCAS